MNGDDPRAPDGAELDDESYVRRIEEEFRRRRGKPLLLSPEDFQRALNWRRLGAPLFVVLSALDAVFRKAAERRPRRTPLTLAYCEPAILEEFEHYREQQLGATSGAEPASPPLADLVELAAQAVERSTAPAPARAAAAAALRALAAESAPRAGTDAVADVARELLDACLAALDPPARAAIEEQARQEIAPHVKDMTARVRERAFAAAVARQVRKTFGLPDLTLLPLL